MHTNHTHIQYIAVSFTESCTCLGLYVGGVYDTKGSTYPMVVINTVLVCAEDTGEHLRKVLSN